MKISRLLNRYVSSARKHQQKRRRFRSQVMEALEPRQLLTADIYFDLSDARDALFAADQSSASSIEGVTVLTHGFTWGNGSGDDSNYLTPIGREIVSQYGGYLVEYQVAAPGVKPTFKIEHFSGVDGDNLDEVVLAFDWQTESSLDSSGWGEAAGDALFSTMVGLGLVNPEAANDLDYHFIAHSFGTAVASEAIERFARYDVAVDHVTYLDPHDFDENGIPIDGSQELWTLAEPSIPTGNEDSYGVAVWDNVGFADVYYQTRSLLERRASSPNPSGDFALLLSAGGAVVDNTLGVGVPSGRPVPGAYNVHFDGDTLDNISNSSGLASHDHGLVWVGYLDSVINPTAPEFANYGYQLSRLANPQSTPARPAVLGSNGAFYSTLQDHSHSSDFLFTNGQPNNSNLNSIGLVASDIDAGGWQTQVIPLDVTNGDFSHGSYLADLSSNVIAPGWSQHGGGFASVISGEGVLSNAQGGIDTLTHNFLYVPNVAKSLRFNLRSVVGGQTINALNDAHTITVSMANAAGDSPFILANIKPSELTSTHTTFEFPIPIELRGQIATIGFSLSGPKQLFNNYLSAGQVLVDNVSLSLVDSTPAAPDLVPVRLATRTQTVEVGGSVNVALEVANSGAATASDFTVQLVLSSDQTIDLTDYHVGPLQLMEVLSSGHSLSFDREITIALGTVIPDGDYYLGVVVDPNNGDVNESNEGNNALVADSIVRVGSPSVAQLPDLSFVSLSSPNSVVAGGVLPVDVTFENNGLGEVPDFDVEFVLWNEFQTIELASSVVSANSLSAIHTELAIPISTPASDSYILQVVGNPNRNFAETTFSNNAGTDRIQVVSAELPNSPGVGFQYPIGDPAVGLPNPHSFNASTTLANGSTVLGHLGVDYGAAIDTPVNAVADGTVAFSGYAGASWGNVVIVKHQTTKWGWDKDVYSFYAHVQPEVTKFDQVSRGQRIARVGPTAVNSTGPHLHFEIRSGLDAGAVAGPGYHHNAFTQSAANSYQVNGYGNSITWHDPEIVLSSAPLTAPPVPDRIDLRPTYVNASISAQAGSDVQVYTEVTNDGTAVSGSYDVTFVLSTNQYISSRDIQLTSVIRAGVQGRSTDRFTSSITLPSNLDVGKQYWIGVLVDSANDVIEYDDANNDLGDATPLVIHAGATSTGPDIVGVGLELSPALSQYPWGQRVNLKYDVQNVGLDAMSTSSVRFLLSNHPTSPSFEHELGIRPLAALPSGRIGGGNASFQMPSSAPIGYTGGALYVRMIVDAENDISEANENNNKHVGEGHDWIRLPRPSSSDGQGGDGRSDLKGVQLTVDPVRNSYEWGEAIDVLFEYTNVGGVTTPDFNYQIVLSENRGFSENDYVLATRGARFLAPQEDGIGRATIRLPSSPPAGFDSGLLFVGAIIDPQGRVNEISRANNRGLGEGIDYAAITIVPPVPTSSVPEPVIGDFTATPSGPVVRGEKVFLTATDVLDDNNNVNEVVFRLDTNNNGLWDETDLYLAHGSRVGTVATAEVRTNANWPNGPVTVLARATDGHGLHSAISSASVNILGLAPGPFADDVYENNDTLETAYNLGGGSSHQLANLALVEDDPDFFFVDVLGKAQQIQATITYTKEEYQGAGVPVGNLTLELYRVLPDGTFDSVDFSNNTGTPGLSTEQVANTATSPGASVADGRYVVAVRGGGLNERNPNYSLDIQITQHANSPVAGPLVASHQSLVQGRNLVLSMSGITNINGQGLDGVHFYADFNKDAQIQFATEYIGTDWAGLNNNGEGPNGEFTVTADTSDWPLGVNNVFAYVQPKFGFTSLAEYVFVSVLPNNPPTIQSLTAPVTSIQGGVATLTATNVSDDDPSAEITDVNFFLDTDDNQVLDANDLPLGPGVQSGNNWSISTSTIAWPLGIATVFAVAADELQLESTPASTTLEIIASDNVQPTIGSFVTPEFAFKGDTLVLLASNVTDPNNDPLNVEFFWDSNANNSFDSEDALLGAGAKSGIDWSINVDTSSFINGPIRVFVEVSDNGIPAYSHVLSAQVMIVDVTGPQIISQIPVTSVFGSIDSVSVLFNEPIDVDSFTISDISSFTGPAGAITIDSLVPVPGSDNQEFRASFARQTTPGAYSLTINPTLLDLGGNELDQDADGTAGEVTEDAYVLSFGVAASDLVFEWANQFSDPSIVRVYDIKVDSADNVIATGAFFGTVDFDPGVGVMNLTSNGSFDAFVAKFDMDGALIWARAAGGSSSDLGAAVTLDNAGNIYATGEYRGTADFDSGSGTLNLTTATGNNGYEDTYIWKLDANGGIFWVKSVGGPDRDQPYDIEVNGSSLYLTGTFAETTDFDPGSGTNNLVANVSPNPNASATDAYLLKLDLSGNFVWARAMGSPFDDVAYGLTIDSTGSLYTVGEYQGAGDFDRLTGGGNVTFSGAIAAFVTKHSSSGDLQWVKTIQSHTIRGRAIDVDLNDDIYIAGEHFYASFVGGGDFDPGPGTAQVITSGFDAYVTKWDSNGGFQWVTSLENAASSEIAREVVIGDDGDVYLAGNFVGDSIAKLSNTGTLEWTKGFAGGVEPQAVAVTNSDRVNVGGWFSGTADFDPDPGTINLTSAGNEDGFIVQLRKPVVVNQPPSLALQNVLTTLPENVDVNNRIKVADIVVSDDGLGTNTVSIGGANASLFEVFDDDLYLKAGTALDFETVSSLGVSVLIDDPTVGITPDDTELISILITDVNEVPSIALQNTVTALSETRSTNSPIRVADIVIADDALGTNILSLSGTDSALFAIQGNVLVVKPGAILDFETNPVLEVTVSVDDISVGNSPDASVSIVVNVTAEDDETPTILNNSATLPEGATLGINASHLSATDVDSTDATLIFTLKGLPANGQIKRDATVLAVNDTFTQQDITDGKISYQHDDSDTIADSLNFTVKDLAGNETAVHTFAIIITPVDDQAPAVSFTRSNPSSGTTNANTLVFLATFSEPVINVDAADFVVAGTTGTVGVTQVTSSQYEVTVSGGDLAGLNGPVDLNLAAAPIIFDLAGNALPSTQPATDETYLVDNTNPVVTSFSRKTPETSPTNAATLVFLATFSEAVTGVDASDFAVTGTTATISVGEVTPSTYNVTVTGGDLATFTGVVGLDLNAPVIQDTAGNLLAIVEPSIDETYSHTQSRTIFGIIDESQSAPGYTQVGSWGPKVSTDYLNSYRYNAAGTGTDKAIYTFNVAPGEYDIATRWNIHANRATDAPYRIYDGATLLATVRVNQELPADDFTADSLNWENLGTFVVSSGTLRVELADDANEYVIADAVRIAGTPIPVPEIGVSESGINLVDGVSSINFGSVLIGGSPVSKTFTISNQGTSNLTLGTLTVPTGYSITTPLSASTLAPAATATFTVSLDTSTGGTFNGEISLVNDDYDEDPFNFAVSGSVTTVQRTIFDIIDESQSAPGYTQVGSWGTNVGANYLGNYKYNTAGTGADKAIYTFDVVPGEYDIATRWHTHANRATDAPYRIYDGAKLLATVRVNQELPADGFTADSLNWENLGTFVIHSGTLRVELADDANEYVIADAVRIAGSPIPVPEIAASESGINLVAGVSSIDYGSVLIGGSPVSKTFTISNQGTSNLTLGTLTVPSGYSITSPLSASTLAPAATATFTVSLDTSTGGTFNGEISLVNNDYDEDPFNFAVSGSVTTVQRTIFGIIDESQSAPGYTQVGGWGANVGANYLGNYKYNTAGTGADKAIYTFNVVPGEYDVATRWHTHANRATNSPYRIYDGATLLATVRVNQELPADDFTADSLSWENLGTFVFLSGTLRVELADDANEYVIADAVRIAGSPIPVPEIAASESGINLVDGVSSIDFGSVLIGGSPVSKTFTISNQGTSNLTLGTLTVPTGYSITTPLSASILAPAATAIFTVSLDTSTGGTFNGEISLVNNDYNENPFNFTVSGSVTTVHRTIFDIIDESQLAPGYTQVGNWGTNVGANYLGNYKYNTAGTGADKAIYTFNVVPGEYDVATRWHTHANRATDAPYRIYDGATLLATVRVNQEIPADDFTADSLNWEKLGTFVVLSGTLRIELADDANEYVIADAVRIAGTPSSLPSFHSSALLVPLSSAPDDRNSAEVVFEDELILEELLAPAEQKSQTVELLTVLQSAGDEQEDAAEESVDLLFSQREFLELF
ncbi:choice-of-anchor D domain-containing protein [Novipirellula sp. SH528]|uniref:golvesin C-terminal-like domain-containing protein n=1 Tax=Novipirellula sp. SH528 TaxID=3454466 RepID=UPI003F9F240D